MCVGYHILLQGVKVFEEVDPLTPDMGINRAGCACIVAC
jgi:hypothetical protein